MHYILLLAVLLMPWPAHAESDFDRAVADLEDYTGKRRIRIPLMGLISFASSFGGPVGFNSFQLAVIEDAGGAAPQAPFEPRLANGWRPVVRVVERQGAQFTQIYGRDEGNWIRILLLTLDGGDGVVMQFRLRPSAFLKFVADKARQAD